MLNTAVFELDKIESRYCILQPKRLLSSKSNYVVFCSFTIHAGREHVMLFLIKVSIIKTSSLHVLLFFIYVRAMDCHALTFRCTIAFETNLS